MKKYKFRLQTILNIKEKILEEKMLELSKVLNVYQEEKKRLLLFETKLGKSNQALTNMYTQNNVLDISKIQLYKNYLSKVMVDIKKQQNVIENVSKLVQLKQLDVNKALKEKRIFEKLKENEQKKFYKKLENKERTEIDDLTLSRYARS